MLGIVGNKQDTDLIAGNIKSGIDIFGVSGNFEGGTPGLVLTNIVIESLGYGSGSINTVGGYCIEYNSKYYFIWRVGFGSTAGCQITVKEYNINDFTTALATVNGNPGDVGRSPHYIYQLTLQGNILNIKTRRTDLGPFFRKVSVNLDTMVISGGGVGVEVDVTNNLVGGKYSAGGKMLGSTVYYWRFTINSI